MKKILTFLMAVTFSSSITPALVACNSNSQSSNYYDLFAQDPITAFQETNNESVVGTNLDSFLSKFKVNLVSHIKKQLKIDYDVNSLEKELKFSFNSVSLSGAGQNEYKRETTKIDPNNFKTTQITKDSWFMLNIDKDSSYNTHFLNGFSQTFIGGQNYDVENACSQLPSNDLKIAYSTQSLIQFQTSLLATINNPKLTTDSVSVYIYNPSFTPNPITKFKSEIGTEISILSTAYAKDEDNWQVYAKNSSLKIVIGDKKVDNTKITSDTAKFSKVIVVNNTK